MRVAAGAVTPAVPGFQQAQLRGRPVIGAEKAARVVGAVFRHQVNIAVDGAAAVRDGAGPARHFHRLQIAQEWRGVTRHVAELHALVQVFAVQHGHDLRVRAGHDAADADQRAQPLVIAHMHARHVEFQQLRQIGGRRGFDLLACLKLATSSIFTSLLPSLG